MAADKSSREDSGRRDHPADPHAPVSDAGQMSRSGRGLSLPEKVLSVHRCLRDGEFPHAFGGALAVGYYGEPRSTLDIDVNVFVPTSRWSDIQKVLGSLEIEIEVDEAEMEQTSQIKLGWGSNFVHLFFSCDPLHEEMRRGARTVPFDDDVIPIVSPEHLIIRKALLDRTKDWLDIEQIFVATSPLDLQEIESWLEQMAGVDDPRMAKLRQTIGELIRP